MSTIPAAAHPTRRFEGGTDVRQPRIGVLSSHPIQYQAPLFRALALRTDLHVYFAHRMTAEQQGRDGFGIAFEWDVDLLAGYAHTFLHNQASKPSSSRFFGCNTPEIAEVIRRESFDAFVLTGWNMYSYMQAMIACRKIGTPVLVRGDSQLQTPRGALKRLAKEVAYPPFLRQFDAHLVVGERNREYLRHYGVADQDLFAVPHFVDNDWFSAQAASARLERSWVREEWGVDPHAHVLLFVGKLIPKKRPADLVDAAARLMRKGQNVAAVLVGSGPLESDLREYARSIDAPVHFTGFKNQSELPGCYAAADLLVLPSDGGETWGLVVNEGMACGLPAVVSDSVGCAPDLIDDGMTGAVFETGNPERLAHAICQFLPLLGSDGVNRAVQRKISMYSVESAVAGVEQAVEAVIRRRGRRGRESRTASAR